MAVRPALGYPAPRMRKINFTRGVPAEESFPTEALVDCMTAALRGPNVPSIMQYGPSYGFMPLRTQLAQQFGVQPESVLLGNGSLGLIDLVGLTMVEPGTTVFVESPTYDRVLTLFRRRGANIVGIPLDGDGISLTALEKALATTTPRLLYVIPDFQNPAGLTLSGDKRRRLVELARKHGFLLLEDAPYRPLRYRGTAEPTLRELAPELTMHMSSFTKQICPGVRVGYLIGPAPQVAKLAKAAEDTYITPNLFGEAAVYEFCARGLLEPQLARLRALYLPRLDALATALERHLPDARWTKPEGGFFMSITLPPGTTTAAVRRAAEAEALALAEGTAFFATPADGERFLRLPYCALTPEEIDEGVARLAKVVKQTS
jgi:2-aminoadipate transaminase